MLARAAELQTAEADSSSEPLPKLCFLLCENILEGTSGLDLPGRLTTQFFLENNLCLGLLRMTQTKTYRWMRDCSIQSHVDAGCKGRKISAKEGIRLLEKMFHL